MNRTPFAVYRQVRLAIGWYGTDYSFYRETLNSYGEPTGEEELVETISGIYHSSERSFIELINSEGASVKSKVSKGILCDGDNQDLSIKQNDHVVIEGKDFYITAIEPVLYGDRIVAYEISVEELLFEGGTL